MSDNTTTTYRIADLSDDDKPREKAIRLGVDKLSVTELIAITLGSGVPGKSVIELSREILASCNNDLDALSRLSIKEMSRKFKGVGPARAVALAAAIELGKKCSSTSTVRQPQIQTSHDAYELVKADMQHLPHEQFSIIVLSRSNRVKCIETISSGGTAATVVDIKLLLKKAIDALAESIILVHNHPSGTTTPSPQDDTLTRRIKTGAESVDIRVIDHLIVASTGYYSYADNGRL